ncbi:MAG: hypothetical protein IJ215_02490 [Clostridia bacterium]|nr:hypothetical protein [Clostridia bacterium]
MALSIHAFAKLMLAQLAKNTKKISGKKPKRYVANIPFNYRERIENILCTDNGWKEKFSVLIDIDEYFDDHFWWEEKLAQEILNVVRNLGKEINFDIISEYMSISLNPEEIENILKQYDKDITKIMEHFVAIMIDRIYTRRHKEEFVDHSARSVAKMHELYEQSVR